MSATRCRLALCLLCLGALSSASGADGVLFQHHFGRLYNEQRWGGETIRGLLESEIAVASARSTVTPLAAMTVTIRDANGTQQTANGAEAFAAHQARNDLLLLVGGLGSAKYRRLDDGSIDVASGLASELVRTYMMALDDPEGDGGPADHAAAWKQVVYARAMDVAAHCADDEHIVAWQIGNEINAASWSFNVIRWLVESGAAQRADFSQRDFDQGVAFDTRIIPFYVRYFFAPTVEALRQAEADSGQRMHIVLGSVAGYANPQAKGFLDDLLGFAIDETSVGDYAPSLWGSAVWEHVDIASVHYHMSQTDPAAPEAWAERLATFKEAWIDTGRIAGFWSTEELGIQAANAGRGAAGCLRICARYLSWVQDIAGAQEDWKILFYGDTAGPTGTRGSDGLQLFWDHCAGLPLRRIDKQVDANGELFCFAVVGSTRRIVTFGHHERDVDRVLTGLQTAAIDFGHSAQVTVYRVADEGISEVPTVIAGSDLSFTETVTIDGSEFLLVLVDMTLTRRLRVQVPDHAVEMQLGDAPFVGPTDDAFVFDGLDIDVDQHLRLRPLAGDG